MWPHVTVTLLHYRNLQQANRLKNQVDLDSTFGYNYAAADNTGGYNFGLGGLGGGTRYNLDPGFRTNLSNRGRGSGWYNRFGSDLGYRGYRGGSDLGYINVLAQVLVEVYYIVRWWISYDVSTDISVVLSNPKSVF